LLDDAESERDEFVNMYHVFISGEGAFRDRLSARIKLVLIKLAETVDESALPSRMADTLDEYIRENCHDEISNTEIGAIFGYHPFYVSRVLKEKKGTTLHQYIIAHRLKIAKSYLETTKKSIAEIAEETGFTDASYFTKSFKGAFGISPKDYRAVFKEEFI
jgi:two-component system response regulator YesN